MTLHLSSIFYGPPSSMSPTARSVRRCTERNFRRISRTSWYNRDGLQKIQNEICTTDVSKKVDRLVRPLGYDLARQCVDIQENGGRLY